MNLENLEERLKVSRLLEHVTRRALPDGREASVRLNPFNARLVVHTPDDMYTEDGWCYQTFPQALAALRIWDGEGEPVGWIKHPTTGRRGIPITCSCGRILGRLEYR